MNKLLLLILPAFFILSIVNASSSTTSTTTCSSIFSFNGICISTAPIIGTTTTTTPITPPPAQSVATGIGSQIYGGALIIYLNPAGYFVFALSNSTAQTGNYLSDEFSQSSFLYQNTIPDQQTLLPLLLTSLNDSNYTYIGTVFYSPAYTDITSLENCIAETNYSDENCPNPSITAGLSAQGLFSFLSSQPTQYNATIVYQAVDQSIFTSISNGLGNSITAFINTFTSTLPPTNTPLQTGLCYSVMPICLGIISGESVNQGINTASSYETITQLQSAISIIQSNYQNGLPLAVYFNYEGNMLNTNPNNAVSAMYQFNQQYNNVEYTIPEENIFLTSTLYAIFIITLSLYILMKLNGE